MTGFPKFACLAFSMLLAVCTREWPLSVDERVAAVQINTLVPRGSSESRAMKTLADCGFQLSRLSGDQASNHVMVGSVSRNGHFWQVGVVIVDHKVAATTVKVTDNTPDAK